MKRLLLIVCCIMAPLTAFAETYDCKLKPDNPWGWIPPRLFIIIAQDNKQALVYDGYIHKAYGEPIPADFKQRNASIFEIGWDVRDMEIDNRANKISGRFNANLNKKTKKITMRVFLNGADILPRGSGKCELAK